MSELTVACVWVDANVPYSLDYVTRLESMTRRFAGRAFRFVCLTDRPWLLPAHIAGIPIARPARLAGWWSKLELFNPAHAFAGRVLYLDLDTLIVDSLARVIDYPSAFALAPHAGTFEGRHGKTVVKRFNSSVMVWNAGSCDALYADWRRDVADRLWGDQDWIGERRPDAAAMPADWFPRLSSIKSPPYPGDAAVILCKKPKNVEAAARWPWFAEAWA